MTGQNIPAGAGPSMRLLGITEVAARLDVSVKTVRRAIARGDLPSHRLGKLLRVSETDLDEYITSRRSG